MFPFNPVLGEAQTTLKDCWEMGRRVIVLYGEGGPQRDNALFWPMIKARIGFVNFLGMPNFSLQV